MEGFVNCCLFCCCFFLSPQAEPIRVLVTGAAGQIAYSLLFSIAKGDVFGKDQVRKTCKWTQSKVFSKLICLETWTNSQQTREQTYQNSCHVNNRPLEGPAHQLVVWFVRGCFFFSCLLCPSQSSWCCWTSRPCCPCWTVLWWSCRTALSRCSEVSHHHLLIMNQFTAQSWSESWIEDNDSKRCFRSTMIYWHAVFSLNTIKALLHTSHSWWWNIVDLIPWQTSQPSHHVFIILEHPKRMTQQHDQHPVAHCAEFGGVCDVSRPPIGPLWANRNGGGRRRSPKNGLHRKNGLKSILINRVSDPWPNQSVHAITSIKAVCGLLIINDRLKYWVYF